MAYQKQNWENLPSTNTPISADRLNHMEEGIYEASAGTSIEVHNDYNNSTTEPYSANYVNKLSNYSTEETVCGMWIDGKPLYRKVIVSSNINSNINTGISNYDDVVKMQMLVKQTTSGDWRNIPWIFSNGSTLGGAEWAGGFYFSNGVIRNQIGNSLKEISRCIIIMEYTKTTD